MTDKKLQAISKVREAAHFRLKFRVSLENLESAGYSASSLI